MPQPSYSPGQLLPSADIATWFLPMVAVKPADTSRSSNATPANDPDLQLAVVNAGVYKFECMMNYESSSGTPGFLFTFGGPFSQLRYSRLLVSTSGTTTFGMSTQGGGPYSGQTVGAGNLQSVHCWGIGAANAAGTFVLQWAQATSNATATILHQNSYLIAQRVS